MKKPKIYVITGVKDNWPYTEKMMECLRGQTYKNFETVVVDDGSTDGTKEQLLNNYPNVIRLVGDGNLWWTGCVYKAVEYVLSVAGKNDYVLTINNDCTFNKNYVTQMVKSVSDNYKYIVGSVVLDSVNRNLVLEMGTKVNWLLSRVYKVRNFDEEIDMLTTRGTLFPISVFKEIGNFNKKLLPHYASDFEFTNRAKRHGYKLVVSQNSIIYNDTKRTGYSGPTGKPISYSQLSIFLFNRKSQVNIIDHIHLVYLCCPWYLIPVNFIYIFAKFLYLSSFTKPFYYFNWPLVKLRNLLLAL